MRINVRMKSDLDRLIAVFDAYCEAVDLAPATVSARFLGRGGRVAELRDGGDMGSRTIHAILVKFSENWPDGAVWPASVPRPLPAADAAEPNSGIAPAAEPAPAAEAATPQPAGVLSPEMV